jgi:hypothetical protein
MKIVGLMCVRDEADLLPQVLPHVRGLVDHLYVYDDGSQDDTWDMVKDEHYAMRLVDDKTRIDHYRGNYHHLLERIKKDFKNEEVWVVITMGDRFYLNKTPREIVEGAKYFDAVEGIQLDFLRHRMDKWTPENDPYPDLSDIRTLARWFKHDEHCIVAYKVRPELDYVTAKYPWPKGIRNVQYKARDMDHKLSLDLPFLEHQGRRTPRAAMQRYTKGQRVVSKKYIYDLSSYKGVMNTMGKFYYHYRIHPWINTDSLVPFIEFYNSPANADRPLNRSYFRGMETLSQMIELPSRTDL